MKEKLIRDLALRDSVKRKEEEGKEKRERMITII